MNVLEYTFWLSLALVFYTYIGYGVVITLAVRIKQLAGKFVSVPEKTVDKKYEPTVALLVAAFNEQDIIMEKVENSLQLDYPREKLDLIFVTDGSTDHTADLVRLYDSVRVIHSNERRGKTAAINRAMLDVDSEIAVFSDANTMLNAGAIRRIVSRYSDPKIGCVAGEKRIIANKKDAANAAGEGLYWRYESYLKKKDAELYSAVGAAGELFSVRTALYEKVETNTILDDFQISLTIAKKGHRIAYAPDAYAYETASASITDELKRKIRIAAGGFQALISLKELLNPFKHGLLSFQYISHRVLRWTLAPLGLVALYGTNVGLLFTHGSQYLPLFLLQSTFYCAALIGWRIESRQLRFKFFFVPYYFFIMNAAVYLGFFRYVRGQQSVLWERAGRMPL